ncbi:MAG: murein biosynthesis integral membrane protein MurJ [Rhodospirillales bacterium]|jgi:putative peptidoglycan lipid II flippase|nr:murein biosynthesis integral membrane protein MurJ [Rhodospirillales bacterium]MBT4040806.1 murein biosynthesis integral membrane protein MurJ [Rhodospirillales bacterium]MBT4627707.1 murein biosynthesis integral membrane protein MurJ [Rhodospirillales bacterium]MBT5352046.1 murein biosynthesis integral membrane protein MurJ [Rhodospirillales bacterium]MBT5521815.1 murein biosynthesis integral membrane protein MurJ [Rhodospirillales bacterium]
MNLLRAITTVGGFTLMSRVLGFVRDMLIAATLGAGLTADAFFVALKFPNLFRRLFAEGAFAAAFVPIFAGKLESEGRGPAVSFAAQAFSILALCLTVFVIVVELAMPWVMQAFAPGFLDDPAKFDLTVLLARITFPYLIFISLTSLIAGVLNSIGRFAAAAATPILLNICMIGAILLLVPYFETPAHALAWGVCGAGVVQLVWLYAALAREGIVLRLPRPRLTEDIRTLYRRALPVALGAGIYQINLLVDTVIASLLPSGSISYLFYADRVNQLPLGVVGVAVGTALLPMLSRHVQSGDDSAAQNGQNRALEFTLLLTLPAAVALFVIAQPVISVLFERGAFSHTDAVATAKALAVYALGLPAYVLVKALAPGFFAREDTKTPVVIAVAAMAVNVSLSLILMGPFLHVGIAMATVISAWLNAACLAIVLRKRGQLILDARLCSRLPRTIVAAAIMGLGLYAGLDNAMPWLDGTVVQRASALAVLVGGGLVVFGLCAQISGAARISDLAALRNRAA